MSVIYDRKVWFSFPCISWQCHQSIISFLLQSLHIEFEICKRTSERIRRLHPVLVFGFIIFAYLNDTTHLAPSRRKSSSSAYILIIEGISAPPLFTFHFLFHILTGVTFRVYL